MEHKTNSETETKKTLGVYVDSALVSAAEKLARDRDWTVSKAAAYLMRRGAISEGLLPEPQQMKTAA